MLPHGQKHGRGKLMTKPEITYSTKTQNKQVPSPLWAVAILIPEGISVLYLGRTSSYNFVCVISKEKSKCFFEWKFGSKRQK